MLEKRIVSRCTLVNCVSEVKQRAFSPPVKAAHHQKSISGFRQRSSRASGSEHLRYHLDSPRTGLICSKRSRSEPFVHSPICCFSLDFGVNPEICSLNGIGTSTRCQQLGAFKETRHNLPFSRVISRYLWLNHMLRFPIWWHTAFHSSIFHTHSLHTDWGPGILQPLCVWETWLKINTRLARERCQTWSLFLLATYTVLLI